MFHRLFFQGKASYIKRLCAWLNILSNHRSQSDQARYSCTLWTFLWTFPRHTSSFLTVLLSVERRSGLLGLCAGLKLHGTAEVHVHTKSCPNTPIHSQLGGEGETSPNKKRDKMTTQKKQKQKTGNPKTLSVPITFTPLVPLRHWRG